MVDSKQHRALAEWLTVPGVLVQGHGRLVASVAGDEGCVNDAIRKGKAEERYNALAEAWSTLLFPVGLGQVP